MTKPELEQLFENNFNCYADNKSDENILAMTKDKFVEVVSNLVEAPVIVQGELLPCPFCGQADWKKLGDQYYIQHDYDCFIRNTSKPLISKTIIKNNDQKIWWNKRAGCEPKSE